MQITEAQTKKEQSSIDWSMSGLDSEPLVSGQDKSSDWSMSPLDSAPLLSQQVKSLEFDEEVNFSSDLDGSFIVPGGKGRREREVRAFFDLILNIMDSLRGPAKNDIRRKEN